MKVTLKALREKAKLYEKKYSDTFGNKYEFSVDKEGPSYFVIRSYFKNIPKDCWLTDLCTSHCEQEDEGGWDTLEDFDKVFDGHFEDEKQRIKSGINGGWYYIDNDANKHHKIFDNFHKGAV